MLETITSITKYFWVKTMGALVALAGFEFFIVNHELNRVIYGLFLIIVVDSVLGVWSAFKMRRLSSWKMGQPMARKICLYSIAIFSAAILSNSSSIFDWFPVYLGIFFILSEVLSIFEKLALLGVPIPTSIIERVNDVFKRYSAGDKKAEDDILAKKQ
jgi:toxin secretion/phage lysis holin